MFLEIGISETLMLIKQISEKIKRLHLNLDALYTYTGRILRNNF